MEGDLPIPALIDVDLISGGRASHMTSLRNAVTAIAPSAKVEPHAAFLAPLSQLMRPLTWLALGLVMLMTLATAAIVVFSAREAQNRHRPTQKVLNPTGH